MYTKDIADRWYEKLDGTIFPMLMAGLGAVVAAPSGARYATGMLALLATYAVLARLLFISPPAPEPQSRLRRQLGRGWSARNELQNELAGAILPLREFVRNAWPTLGATAAISGLMLADIPNI